MKAGADGPDLILLGLLVIAIAAAVGAMMPAPARHRLRTVAGTLTPFCDPTRHVHVGAGCVGPGCGDGCSGRWVWLPDEP